MTRLTVARLHLGLTAALGVMLAPALAGEGDRIVTLGGAVTEIAVGLGAADRIVARDTTSTYPESITGLPDVGYVRALSPENVLALDPSLILAEGDAGPPEAVEVLTAAGVPFVTIPEATGPDSVIARIRAVAAALGMAEQGEALAAEVATGLEEAKARAATVAARKRVLFVLSLQSGRVMAGGEGTEAEAIIRLAGGENAGTGFAGYKPMTDEAVLQAAPDVILMMDRKGDLAVADAQIMDHPALGATPAAETGSIIRMDGMMLLGFGPRTPEAANSLFNALYGAGG